MNVIGHSAYGQRFELVGSGDAANIGPELVLHRLRNNGPTVFGRENTVQQDGFISNVTWHGIVSYSAVPCGDFILSVLLSRR